MGKNLERENKDRYNKHNNYPVEPLLNIDQLKVIYIILYIANPLLVSVSAVVGMRNKTFAEVDELQFNALSSAYCIEIGEDNLNFN